MNRLAGETACPTAKWLGCNGSIRGYARGRADAKLPLTP